MKRVISGMAMLLFLGVASAQAQEMYDVHLHSIKPDKKQLTAFNKYEHEHSFTKQDNRKFAKEQKEKMRKARIRSKITEARAKRKYILAKQELKKRGLMARKERPFVSFR